MESYSQKLKSPKWQKKRLEVFERDSFTCQLCGDKNSPLSAHHTEYEGDPWDIDSDKIITLCDKCHTFWHEYLCNHHNNNNIHSINIVYLDLISKQTEYTLFYSYKGYLFFVNKDIDCCFTSYQFSDYNARTLSIFINSKI